MFSIEPFLSKNIFALKTSDDVDFALEMMEEWKVQSLPVVEDKRFLGMVEKADLEKSKSLKKSIKKDLTELIPENTFMWKLLELFQENQDEIKVVVNENQEYLGCITPQNILRSLNNSFTINSDGIYLRIDISSRDYSLAQISHLAESENVKIMGLWIFGDDPDELTILLKTNTVQVSGFVSTLRRMGYNVLAQEITETDSSTDSNRYAQLLKYLDI